MKKAFVIFVLVALGLSMFACSDSDSNPTGSKVDFSNPLLSFPYQIMVTPYGAGFYCLSEVTSYSVKIDGESYDLVFQNSDSKDDDQAGSYAMLFKNFEVGQKYYFEISLNNHTLNDSLLIMDAPVVDFPDFNPEEDYHMQWSLLNQPKTQVVSFYVEDWLEEDESSVDIFEEVAPTAREYTISRSKFSDVSGQCYVEAEILAYHYALANDILLLSVGISNEERPTSNTLLHHAQQLSSIIQ